MTDSRDRAQSDLVALRAVPDLSAIFDDHFDFVWNALQRLGVRPADLEDLAHEVFLKVQARLGDYDSSRPIRPWLFGFAYRVAAAHRRLVRHRVEVYGHAIEPVDPVRLPDESAEAQEDSELVRNALEAVDFDRRPVLLLHDGEDIPVPAIAAELGIPVNTAYSRLRVAREEFGAAIRALRSRRRAS
ncbi:MAG TPA: sigma-70 family RNA polymerase sigma factor [Polyangiaceae bacterium]|nr:sigma-70 family RNA polymerase sigma factor [Polyangiaceae bacterium]